jgi:hypothetical protein
MGDLPIPRTVLYFPVGAPSHLASGLEKRSSSMNLVMLGFSCITAAMASSCWRPPSVPGSVISQTSGTFRLTSLHTTQSSAVWDAKNSHLGVVAVEVRNLQAVEHLLEIRRLRTEAVRNQVLVGVMRRRGCADHAVQQRRPRTAPGTAALSSQRTRVSLPCNDQVVEPQRSLTVGGMPPSAELKKESMCPCPSYRACVQPVTGTDPALVPRGSAA